jgi:hypothetical protein
MTKKMGENGGIYFGQCSEICGEKSFSFKNYNKNKLFNFARPCSDPVFYLKL